MKIRRVRLHTGGHALSPRQLQAAANYFSKVVVDTPRELNVAMATSVDGMISLPAVSPAASVSQMRTLP